MSIKSAIIKKLFGHDSPTRNDDAVRIYELLVRIQSLSMCLEGISVAKQQAVNIIAPQIASLRFGTFVVSDGVKVREKGELHNRLNYDLFGDLTGYEFWSAFFLNLLMSNNAYAKKVGIGRLQRLEILESGLVTFDSKSQKYIYGDSRWPYSKDEIFHVKCNSPNGIRGLEYEVTTTIFELQEQAEKLAKAFFENGGNVQRIWEFVGELSPEQAASVKELLEKVMKGSENWMSNPIVPWGLKCTANPLNAKESQMLETRQYNSEQILALYGIDAKNLDLQKIYDITIAPMLENIEQAIAKRLLTDAERAKYKVEFIVNGRFKGNVKERYGIYEKALQVHTINEVRAWENYPTLGPEYDTVINPNTASAKVNETRQQAAGGAKNE